MLPIGKAHILESMGSVKIIEDVKQLEKKSYSDEEYVYRCEFTKRPGTRVVWIQNYDKNGGAEISNFNCVAIGRRLGFDVVGFIINDPNSLKLFKKADIVIVNNLHSSNKESIIDYLYKTTIPWIKYDHDLSENECELFKKSSLNVFISPLHLCHYVAKCGDEIIKKSVCLPLAINPDLWKYKKNNREPNTVFVPSYFKCRDNVTDYMHQNPDKKYFVAGNTVPANTNAVALGEIEQDKIQEYYHKCETVYHIPDRNYAGDRVIFESILCGCKLISGETAGHTSWNFNWKDRDTLAPILKNAIYEFWHNVERVANAA